MAALKDVKTLDMVGGEITKVAYEGAEYERVEGDAKVGDIIRLPGNSYKHAIPGGFYAVISVIDRDVIVMENCGNHHRWTEGLYELFRKKHVRLKVGDYVKVVGDTYNSDIVRGAIVKITDLADGDGDLRFELVGDDYYDYAKPSSLEKVSAEEAKWAEIGRKVGEYKKGDVVAYDDRCWFGNSGIGEVTKATNENNYTRVDATNNRGTRHNYYLDPEKLTLSTPVEARFDRS